MNGEEIIWIKMSGWKPDNPGGRVFNPSKRVDVVEDKRSATSGWKPDNFGGRVFNPSKRSGVAGAIRLAASGWKPDDPGPW